MKWTKGESKEHKIELDLDLTISEILKSNQNIEMRLQVGEQEIRERVFCLMVERVLPRILEDTGVDFSQPPEDISTQAHTKHYSEAEVGIPTNEETSLYIRDKMKLLLNLDSSSSMNAIQALYANRGSVASVIANEIVKLLKKSVLKVDEQAAETTWSLTENQLESLQHRVKKSSADEN